MGAPAGVQPGNNTDGQLPFPLLDHVASARASRSDRARIDSFIIEGAQLCVSRSELLSRLEPLSFSNPMAPFLSFRGTLTPSVSWGSIFSSKISVRMWSLVVFFFLFMTLVVETK